MLELKNIKKQYGDRTILQEIDVTFGERGLIFILGSSGAGKSTLLNIAGLMDGEYEGSLFLNEIEMPHKEKSMTEYRKKNISFVFQELNLLHILTVRENIQIALNLSETAFEEEKYQGILKRMGIEELSERRVDTLSGGERQRVAIARALLRGSRILFADEPTGNLDEDNAKKIFTLLKEISSELLVVIVSHDRQAAKTYGDGIIQLEKGKIREIVIKKEEAYLKQTIVQDETAVIIKEKKTWIIPYAVRNVWARRKKLVPLVLAMFVSLLCAGLVLGMLSGIKTMFHHLNTILLENDKYSMMNLDDLWYREIDTKVLEEIEEEKSICYGLSYCPIDCTVSTENRQEKVSYHVFDSSDFFRERYKNIKGTFPNEKQEVIVNAYMANEFFKTEDCIGKTIVLQEAGNKKNKITCKITAVKPNLLGEDKASLYMQKDLLDELAVQKLEENLIMSVEADGTSDCFIHVSKISSDTPILYGRNVKKEDEIVINLNAVQNILEDLQLSQEKLEDGKLGKDAVTMILGRTVELQAFHNILAEKTIVGISGYEGETEGSKLYIMGNAIDILKQNNNFKCDIYLKDLHEHTLETFQALVAKWNYHMEQASGPVLSSLMSKMTVVIFFFAILTTIVVIVTATMIYVTTRVSLLERMYEVGVLKSMGACKWDVFKIFMIQNILFGLFSSILAVSILFILYITGILNLIHMEQVRLYVANWKDYLWVVLIGIGLSILGGLSPVYKVSNTSVKEALRRKDS